MDNPVNQLDDFDNRPLEVHPSPAKGRRIE